MSYRLALTLLACALMGGLSPGSLAFGLEIREVRWGFDGSLVEGSFSPVFLLVVNDQTTPFEGTLALQRGLPTQRVDAPIRESLYLGPNQSRWVPFFPYCSQVGDSLPWLVSWGSGRRERFELPQPQSGGRATVLLTAGGTLTQPPTSAKTFPEDLFPTRSTGCDGLGRVVLDHEPRWSEPQRQTFLEWLRQGGELHVLHGSDNRWPRFGGSLLPLQGLTDSQALGAGRIIRHDRDLGTFSKESWQTVILGQVESADADATIDAATQALQAAQYPNAQPFNDDNYGEFDPGGLLDHMRDQTRTDHNWPLIHLLCLTYIGLIFPGGWILARRRPGDYRLLFGLLLGVITLFSLLLLVVGRRSAGEVATVNSLLLARPVDDDRVSVSGWSGAFVTTGGTYTLEHAGQGGLYASGQQIESVPGWIAPQGPPRMSLELPPFSSRSFVHRVNTANPFGTWQVTEFATETGSADLPLILTDLLKQQNIATRMEQVTRLRQLTIRWTGSGEPLVPKQLQVVHGQLIYSLAKTSETGEWKLAVGSQQSVWNAVQDQENLDWNQFGRGVATPRPPPEMTYTTPRRELLRRALRLTSASEAVSHQHPAGRLLLLAWYSLPPEMQVADPQFSSQRGGCLLVQDLPIEETP